MEVYSYANALSILLSLVLHLSSLLHNFFAQFEILVSILIVMFTSLQNVLNVSLISTIQWILCEYCKSRGFLVNYHCTTNTTFVDINTIRKIESVIYIRSNNCNIYLFSFNGTFACDTWKIFEYEIPLDSSIFIPIAAYAATPWTYVFFFVYIFGLGFVILLHSNLFTYTCYTIRMVLLNLIVTSLGERLHSASLFCWTKIVLNQIIYT